MSLKLNNVFLYLLAVVAVIGFVPSNQVLAAPGDLNWSTKASLPTPQQGVALAAGANGKLYSIGGSANGSRDVVEYNPQTDIWTNRAQVPIFRLFSAAATGIDGKIYVIGGLGTSTVQAYDPNSNTWTNRASLPHNLYFLSAVTASNGKIYAVGGLCNNCSDSIPGLVYEYDQNTNTWTEKSPMPIPTYGHGLAATSDGKIYAISGEGGDSMRKVVQEYDTNTDIWSRKADLPSPRYLLGAATLSNGKIYAVGGRTTLPPDGTPVEYSTVESYDPTTDTWSSENPMQSVRASLGVANLEGVLYAVGGFDCHFTSDCSDLNVVEAAGIETANQAPSVDAGGLYQASEGSSVTVSATGSDPENGTLTYAWDLDNNGSFETAGQSVSFSAAMLDGPTARVITVRVTDNGNLTATDEATIDVMNVAPTIGEITSAPLSPITVGTAINTNVAYSEPSVSDTHTAVWSWGDGTTSTGNVDESADTVTDSHTYATPGVYTVGVTISDDDGGTNEASYEYIVVYDNSSQSGFVTGSGSINSPAGAYVANPSLTGIGRFGFISKYQQGANIPTGNTQFRFQTAQFTFDSASYDWLVVAGAQAKFKGVGTVNGSGNYGFLLSATDGIINGGGGVDKFRIKVWDRNNNDSVVYDNNIGAADNSNPTTVITNGNIVIH